MKRRFVAELGHQENIDQVFLASQKQLRPNRNGNLYMQVDLSDRSGSISARMWNASEGDFQAFDNGDYVRVEGATQLFQGAIQLIATRISKAASHEIVADDFVVLDARRMDQLAGRLQEHLRKLTDPGLRALAECFLVDQALMRMFAQAPAGVKNHHAYSGGLVEHVVALMDLARGIAGVYPMLDLDLLVMGCFLHDLGKVEELTYDRDFAYSDEGQLIGHLVMGVEMLDRKLAEAESLLGEPISTETVLRLKHMIVSHHGAYEYGSPKLPMTLEAIALAQLDNLDAKMHAFDQLMREDPNVDSPWTNYHPSLGRKLFKGARRVE